MEINRFFPLFQEILNLGMFFCLYIAQAIPMSFFSTTIQVSMRQTDYSLSSIALLQLTKPPWILKFLWAPLIDRHCITMKDYKRCITSSEIVYALLILLVGLLGTQTDLYLIIGLAFLSLVASATQDIATDTLAVLPSDKRDKSSVSSMQPMGSFGGTLVGTGALLLVLQHYGWHAVIPCLCVFVLLVAIPLLKNGHMKMTVRESAKRTRLTDFIWFFAHRSIWKQIGFLLLYYAGIIGILSVLRLYLVGLDYSVKEIGIMIGIVGTGAAFMSSFLAGSLARKIGRCYSRTLFAMFILFTTLYFMCISWTPPSLPMFCLSIVLLRSVYGMATVVVYTTAMDCIRKGCEGTDFAIQTVLTHLSGLLMAFLSRVVVDKVGYHGLFVFEVALTSISLIYIFCFSRKESQTIHS